MLALIAHSHFSIYSDMSEPQFSLFHSNSLSESDLSFLSFFKKIREKYLVYSISRLTWEIEAYPGILI